MLLEKTNDWQFPSAQVGGRRRRYDAVSMSLHWLTLVLLIAIFATIWARDQVSDGATAELLLTLHRSAGLLIWLATLGRLAWKMLAADHPPLPLATPLLQRWAARANEYALYASLVVQPLTGFVQSVAPFPSVMARDKALTHLFHDIHETGATVLLALVGLHACAALFHGLVLRDGVLRSMLPGGKSLAEK
jgi:superoxide oxidase